MTKAPGVPAMQVKFRSGTVGVSSINVRVVSPSGTHSIDGAIAIPPYPVNPAVEVIKSRLDAFGTVGFGLYSEPGAWSIQTISLYTNDGQIINYYGDQLAAILANPVIQVANPSTPDTTPPKVGKGMILTPTISLSSANPYFAAKINVVDDLSGVSSAYLTVGAPDGSSVVFPYATLDLPVTNGPVVVSLLLQMNAPTGTYTVDSLTVCDLAQNCSTKSSTADLKAVFGKATFDVMN